jgi:class 3 adenylate cyclase
VLELGDGALAPTQREVTVLFSDIRDFTRFAERAGAAEVVAELNDFFSHVVPLVAHHGGHANKFVGDGLLAVFGAPARLPDHADHAVAAAMGIVAAVERIDAGRLRIGIGGNTGPVVAGTVGGGGRVEFTVIGDAVNTASRVEAVTRDTGDDILITEATRRLLRRDHGELAERPTVELKGKTERVRLWALAPAPDQQPGIVGSAALPSSTASRL